MRRLASLALVLGVVLAALLAQDSWRGARAQEAGGVEVAPGVTFEPVADGAEPSLVADRAGVRFEWARFAPGAAYTVPTDDASLLVVAVESGALTLRSSAPLVVNRSASPGVSAAAEQVPAAADVTLAVGDSFVRPAASRQDMRNDGAAPAVALTAFIAPDLAQASAGAAATPTADRSGGLVVALAVVVVPLCPEGYVPAEVAPVATPGGGGGGGGAGGVAVAIAAAPECVGAGGGSGAPTAATPMP